MTKQVRDWQKDMKTVKDFKFTQTLVNGIQPMFHGQFSPHEPIEYALEYWLQETKKLCEVNQQKQREILNLQIREKKLREAIESLIDNGLLMIPEGENRAMDLLESMYPLEKEEEAKKYTFKAILHLYDGIRTTVHKVQTSIEAKSAEDAEKKLRKDTEEKYKRSSHLSLSSLQLELVEEGKE